MSSTVSTYKCSMPMPMLKRVARILWRSTIGLLVFLLTLAILGTVWWSLQSHTPVSELLSEDAAIDLTQWDGSMTDGENPAVMVLGTTHLNQEDTTYPDAQFHTVTEKISTFNPDMVVVEYLPPQYPVGKGRDYRAGFDLDAYADDWSIDRAVADSMRTVYQQDDRPPSSPCTRGQHYFLARDFANALHHWVGNDCSFLEQHEMLAQWANRMARHELAKIGTPVARANEVHHLVPFDYQGPDAEWFIFDEMLDVLRSGRVWALRDFWPILPQFGVTAREWGGHIPEHSNTLPELLHFANSPELIGLQYWAYEEIYPSVTWQDEPIGQQQTDNYWLRNERMFAYMETAIEEENPERVLVIVGLGHKYFLDELVQEAGYRWIDPRTYLPEPA